MSSRAILIVCNRLDIGGAEIYVLSIANFLAKKGYEVHIASSGGSLVSKLDPLITHHMAPTHGKSLILILKTAYIIKNIVKRYKINLIHTNSVFTCLSTKIATLLTVKKVFYTAHSWGTKKKPIAAKIVNFCADIVIAVSGSTGADYVKNGLDKRKLRVIHNGIDPEKFCFENPHQKRLEIRKNLKISETTPVIINVGRMEEERKGHYFLIEAFSYILQKIPDCKLVLVGDGYLRKSLEELTTTLKIGSNVLFAGNQQDIPDLLVASDIFCLPSLWEGLPLVIAEAMIMGLPVVATEVNGIPEMIKDGETGFLVRPQNSNQLAEKITFLLENKELYSQMSIKSKIRAQENFTLPIMMEKLEKEYSKYW